MFVLVILISPLKKVEEATKLAQVYDDIKAMPEGFERSLVKRVSAYQAVKNNGLAMSRHDFGPRYFDFGRLPYLRLMPRQNMPLLDNLKHPARDKTTIITAHRLSAVVHC